MKDSQVVTDMEGTISIPQAIADHYKAEAKESILARRFTDDITTIENALSWGQASLSMIENGKNEARIMLSYATGLTQSELITKSKELMKNEDFEEYLYNVTDDVLTVTYVRDGKTNDVELTPKYVDTVNSRGIALIPYEIDSPANFFKALAYAAKMPPTIWNITVRGIKDAIAGKVKAYNLVSGPIGITTMVNDVVADEEDSVTDKVYMLIMLSAVISIALAFCSLARRKRLIAAFSRDPISSISCCWRVGEVRIRRLAAASQS